MADLTLPQKLLVAASKFDGQFTASGLVVVAHEMDAASFGLDGYPQHPDSNRVLALLMGERGLVRKGLFEKLGPKKYRLTDRGREVAGDVGNGRANVREAARMQETDGRYAAEIVRCLGTRAYSRFVGGLPDSINWFNALDFWDVDQTRKVGSTGTTIEHRARQRSATVGKAIEEALEYGDLAIGRRHVKASEVRALADLQAFLLKQFARRMKGV